MILHTSVLALASALVAGSLTLASVAPSQVANSVTAAEDLLIHGPTASAAPPLAIYDSIGHAQLSPAETYCDLHQTVTEGLTHDFAETFRARRVSADGLQVELWASDLMGTWTALHQGNDGISCVVASGVDWSATVESDDLLELAMQEVVYGS